jgi:transcriptional regulator of NAD metabolism
MAQFTVRVELHHADDDDYETLHSAMEEEGFSRLITSNDGTVYHLPTAEYNRDASLTRQQVLDSAKKAAAKTKKEYGILVTESEGRKWIGLTKA